MNFVSLEYMAFLPVVFLLYWTAGAKSRSVQNTLIVIASCVFYGWTSWKFLGLLLLTAVSTYMAGKLIGRSESEGRRKAVLWGALVLNLGILFYFKYFNFFVDAFVDAVSLFGVNLRVGSLRILLPIGISFYTFTALSYTIDVYQRKIEVTDDWLAFSAFVMFFPSILSGPISRAQKQLPQYFVKREFDAYSVINACKSILWGGVIKLCLADRLGIYVDAVYGNMAQHSGITLLVTSILYTIQIYADFAGYSLMAIGSGKLLGIDLQTNFMRPYLATTVTEFWRRWHISLTTWFRDYIYIPLGGNRVSQGRWVFNTMVVFVVSGLWHGAAYTFLVWGALHGVCMVIERLVYGGKIKQISNKPSVPNILRMLLTFSVVSTAWIFFRVETLADASLVLRKIFTDHGSLFVDADTLGYAAMFLLLVAVVDCVQEYFPNKLQLMNSKYAVVRWGTYITLTVLIMLFGVLDGGSFIYFQF